MTHKMFHYEFKKVTRHYVNTSVPVKPINEPRRQKPVFGVSDQVRHKPGCSATEDG